MAGGSSYSDDYIDELRKHQSDRVRLLDWVSGEALDELLTNAMLFVLPSDLEGLSLALLDAMGAGVCVLTSDIPENCEVVEGAGFTFRHGDVTDLQRMLGLLIGDQRVRQAAALAALVEDVADLYRGQAAAPQARFAEAWRGMHFIGHTGLALGSATLVHPVIGFFAIVISYTFPFRASSSK